MSAPSTAFAVRYGYRESTNRHPCLRRLQGRRCLQGSPGGSSGCEGCEPGRAYLDHARVWIKKGSVACLTGEPYQVSPDDLAQLTADAKKFGLDIWITTHSWHNPGCVLIELRAAPEHETGDTDDE